jgi:hypothetical protein
VIDEFQATKPGMRTKNPSGTKRRIVARSNSGCGSLGRTEGTGGSEREGVCCGFVGDAVSGGQGGGTAALGDGGARLLGAWGGRHPGGERALIEPQRLLDLAPH